MDCQPEGFDGEFFDLLFKSAEIANFAPTERNEYFQDMTTERDRANQLATAESKGLEKGLAEGRAEGRVEIARAMLKDGLHVEVIAKYSGLSVKEIERLR